MKKDALVVSVRDNLGCSARVADDIVSAFVEQVVNALARGETLQLPGFGSFSCRQRGARIGRHPKTGATLKIDAHRVVVFKAGKTLREGISRSVTSESVRKS